MIKLNSIHKRKVSWFYKTNKKLPKRFEKKINEISIDDTLSYLWIEIEKYLRRLILWLRTPERQETVFWTRKLSPIRQWNFVWNSVPTLIVLTSLPYLIIETGQLSTYDDESMPRFYFEVRDGICVTVLIVR